jgi:hypothetical protein
MDVIPLWTNKHLLLPQIDDKRGEGGLEITSHLIALVKRVIELRQADLRVCHCAEEFTLRWIRPLDRREKRAYECSWLADLTREPAEGKILHYLVIDF